jgi:hypothetical protein
MAHHLRSSSTQLRTTFEGQTRSARPLLYWRQAKNIQRNVTVCTLFPRPWGKRRQEVMHIAEWRGEVNAHTSPTRPQRENQHQSSHGATTPASHHRVGQDAAARVVAPPPRAPAARPPAAWRPAPAGGGAARRGAAAAGGRAARLLLFLVQNILGIGVVVSAPGRAARRPPLPARRAAAAAVLLLVELQAGRRGGPATAAAAAAAARAVGWRLLAGAGVAGGVLLHDVAPEEAEAVPLVGFELGCDGGGDLQRSMVGWGGVGFSRNGMRVSQCHMPKHKRTCSTRVEQHTHLWRSPRPVRVQLRARRIPAAKPAGGGARGARAAPAAAGAGEGPAGAGALGCRRHLAAALLQQRFGEDVGLSDSVKMSEREGMRSGEMIMMIPSSKQEDN